MTPPKSSEEPSSTEKEDEKLISLSISFMHGVENVQPAEGKRVAIKVQSDLFKNMGLVSLFHEIGGQGEKEKLAFTQDRVAGYTSNINGFNVTNAYTPSKTDIPVTKIWQDDNNRDGKRPKQITVRLYADGIDTGKRLILTENEKWTGSFTGLDVYREGRKINYSIKEEGMNAKYTVAITGDPVSGFKVTNRLEPGTPTPGPRAPKTGEKDLFALTGLFVLSLGLTLALKKSHKKFMGNGSKL